MDRICDVYTIKKKNLTTLILLIITTTQHLLDHNVLFFSYCTEYFVLTQIQRVKGISQFLYLTNEF